MKKSTTRLCTSLLLAAAAQTHAGVDAKLLDMLLANGSISKAQHAELSADLAREQRASRKAAKDNVSKKEFTEFRQLAGWAANTTLRGDMRVREETIDVEARPGDDTLRDRQRIRARLALVTQVNPEIELGMQIASGNNADRRSTNQDLDNYFDRKALWLDLAYIDYHPLAVPGLKLFGGKMKQPWMAVGDAAWDGDINPEGLAATYQKKNGSTTLFGSTGYFVLKDSVDGEGVEMSHDLSLLELQGGVAFDPSESMRLTLGATVNEFLNESQGFPPAPTVALRANGNTTDRFGLAELFGQLDIIGLPLPLSLYGQYIRNYESRDLTLRTPTSITTFEDGGEDTAYLFGLRTNIAGIALDYNYRDIEANAVVGTLTDSDFAGGLTNNSGHKLKAQYDFMKNANVSLTYFMAESNVINPLLEDIDVDTLHLDLNAKF